MSKYTLNYFSPSEVEPCTNIAKDLTFTGLKANKCKKVIYSI